jgi:hypothetical protein
VPISLSLRNNEGKRARDYQVQHVFINKLVRRSEGQLIRKRFYNSEQDEAMLNQ